MLTDSIDSHPALSSPRKLTKDAQHCTNQRSVWGHIDQWEGRKLSQEAGQYRGAILRKYRHQRGLGPDVTHNGINIAPQSTSSDQDREQRKTSLNFLFEAYFVIRFCYNWPQVQTKQFNVLQRFSPSHGAIRQDLHQSPPLNVGSQAFVPFSEVRTRQN